MTKKKKPKGPIIPEMTPQRIAEQKALKRWEGVRTTPTFWDAVEERGELRSELGTAWGSPKVRYPRRK